MYDDDDDDDSRTQISSFDISQFGPSTSRVSIPPKPASSGTPVAIPPVVSPVAATPRLAPTPPVAHVPPAPRPPSVAHVPPIQTKPAQPERSRSGPYAQPPPVAEPPAQINPASPSFAYAPLEDLDAQPQTPEQPPHGQHVPVTPDAPVRPPRLQTFSAELPEPTQSGANPLISFGNDRSLTALVGEHEKRSYTPVVEASATFVPDPHAAARKRRLMLGGAIALVVVIVVIVVALLAG